MDGNCVCSVLGRLYLTWASLGAVAMYEISFDLHSYQVEGGRWKPKAIVKINTGDSLRMIEVLSAKDIAFKNKQAADRHSEFLARQYIESKL